MTKITRTVLEARTLIPGAARGELLRLDAPISFWGGVDPATGIITQPRHPNHLQCVSARVLALPASIGSSSSSAILLELLYNGKAPAALLMGEPDAILTLGVVVAREMGYGAIPVLHTDVAELPAKATMEISESGLLRVLQE